MNITSDVDSLARNLYDTRSKPCPPITDSSWEALKTNTPNHYTVLCKVAKGLMDND